VPYFNAEENNLPEYEWYHDGVAFCLRKKFMQSDSDKFFRPSQNVTWAEFLELLFETDNTDSKETASLYADAVEWAKKVDDYGVEVILPTSKAGDGARTGYDIPVIKAMAAACRAKIVASGGAGKMEDFLEAAQAGAQVLLAASVFHFHMIDIPELKEYLGKNGYTF
jgi:imidazole glycerol phosphate synthase subunit HisF